MKLYGSWLLFAVTVAVSMQLIGGEKTCPEANDGKVHKRELDGLQHKIDPYITKVTNCPELNCLAVLSPADNETVTYVGCDQCVPSFGWNKHYHHIELCWLPK